MLQNISNKQSFQRTGHSNQLKVSHQKFRPGEILKGVVIQKLRGGEVIISGKGKQFLAYTNLNLEEGSTHHFQVRKVGIRTDLKVLGGLIEELESPIKLWASNRVIRANLEGILAGLIRAHKLPGISNASRRALVDLKRFSPVIIFNDKINDPSVWLSSYLQGNGIFWENKIARFLHGKSGKTVEKLMLSDLKGVLMNLMKNLAMEDQNQDYIKSILSDLKKALFLIEQDQFLNLASIKEGFGWFWFMPGNTEGGFQGAELFVKKKGEEDELAISLLLEFTKLGKMQADISIVNSCTCVKICAEDRQRADIITENLPILKKNLQALGMSIGTITCDVKESQGQDCMPFSTGEPFSQAIHLVI